LTRQLIDFQIVSVKNLKDGLLWTELSKALTQLLSKFNSGNLITPICFMNSIEDVFEDLLRSYQSTDTIWSMLMATREHGWNTQKWQQLEFPTLQTSPTKHGW
jgi:hypothetical protein